MDLSLAIKKIRTQIKFGRGIDAEKSLKMLWDEFKGKAEEKTILEVYALELLKGKKSYERAIPVLQRLVQLDLDDGARAEVNDFLDEALKREKLKPIEPDTSNPEFMEFMRNLHGKEIFKAAAGVSVLEGGLIIDNLEDARRLAWDQNIELPFQSWNKLRSDASRQIYGYCPKNKIKIDPAYDELVDIIAGICRSSVSPTMMNFFDDIQGDLIQIALGKLVGVMPPLHSQMWNAYLQRGFPCGWRGNYPEGDLCVFPNE